MVATTREEYKLIKCELFGFAQKETRQLLKTIHNSPDPNKYFLEDRSLSQANILRNRKVV